MYHAYKCHGLAHCDEFLVVLVKDCNLDLAQADLPRAPNSIAKNLLEQQGADQLPLRAENIKREAFL
jgi:hypothetical protein